ncbi:MAG: putative toxin-antitoxin system toxin component, PIN family [Candidatus Kapaibacterium sp.]
MSKLRIVLDTNILLASLSRRSPWRPVFDALLAGGFDLVVCNEILSEYHEIIQRKTTAGIAANLVNTLLFLPNVETNNVYFNWGLIAADPDDNKFVDCAIAGRADYIVSNDKHFATLSDIEFPVVRVISLQKFIEILRQT